MSQLMTREQIQQFAEQLRLEEHSPSTVCKYHAAVTSLYDFLPAEKEITKEQILQWKARIAQGYSASTANVMISAVNSFFSFMSWEGLRIRQIKTQRKIYRDRERELTKAEYLRLLEAARKAGNLRLFYLMQTLASTGIRISELKFITVESLDTGSATVDCKGKQRTILLPKRLRKTLRKYCKNHGIIGGSIFITRSGRPMDRSNIWKELRKLCPAAQVETRKVFPHNFRHLFAVSFYALEKDVAKLADLLGHASINTTRIYIMESGAEHERQMERLGLVL